MNLLLTDVLRCPRCGPAFGLVLLADRIDAERRVQEGRLGCSNCRTSYPIRDGVLDLRLGGESMPAARTREPASEEAALRRAALLGLSGGAGRVVIRGPGTGAAAGVAALAPDVQVIAMEDAPEPAHGPAPVDRVAAGPGLPFADGSLRAVALTGGADPVSLDQALRALTPGGRLLVEAATQGVADALRDAGAQIMLDQEGTMVAQAAPPTVARPGPAG